jgi:hypothetical protein
MKRPFNKQSQLLRKYLLHDLGETEQEHIELRLLSDKEFTRCLAVTQDDLIDDYVAGRLSDREIEMFKQHYVTTPERLQRLNFGIAFDRYVSERIPVHRSDTFDRLFAFARTHPLKTATAVVVLLFIFGVVLFIPFRVNQHQIAQNLQQEFARLNVRQETDSRPLSVLKLSSGDARALMLRHNLVRGDDEERSVELTSTVTLLRLVLEAPSGAYKTYQAMLQTAEGKDLASVSDLKARSEEGAQFVIVNIPARLITRGDYQLKLMGISEGGRVSDVGLYPFRVTTR